MSLLSWFCDTKNRPARRRCSLSQSVRRRSVVPRLEELESRLTPSPTLSTLASFNGTNGSGPNAVIMDSSGNLYGTTSGGADAGDGTVFKLAKGSSTIDTLVAFGGTGNDGLNGANPSAGLIMDSSGNLYGTTLQTVFEVPKGGGAVNTLATFDLAHGTSPSAPLIMDSSGNLYGTTGIGGDSGKGVVFEVVKGSGQVTTLASFNDSNGAYPGSSGVIMDSNGNLYGTTVLGGASGQGTIFEWVKSNGQIKTLASFGSNGNNGAQPSGGVIMDHSGNLYGTTDSGGAFGDGTVFELAKGSNTITTLASFNSVGGSGLAPEAGVIMDGSGNLYGTTYGLNHADYAAGTVFELAKGSSTITTLAQFNGSNGENPAAPLIMDSNGNLYGTTGAGGASGDGTIFELQGAITQPPPPPAPSPTPTPPPTPAPPLPPALNVPSLLAMLDSLFGGIETVNANGTETIVDDLFGITQLVATFDSSGNLMSVDLFGIDVTFLFE
jgi:uncharacterized repeat protein (TIGR03803 family)